MKTLLFAGAVFFLSCREKGSTLFEQVQGHKSGIRFKNTLIESKEFNVLNYLYFYNGGGVAIGDVNNDGLQDIYFTGNLVASHLYLNLGDWKFSNIAAQAGVEAAGLWNTGVTMADINQDGWLDIYVCRSAAADPNARRNLLFINNGEGENGQISFREEGALYGIADQAYTTHAAFFDFDRDGDLDLFNLNHSVPEYSNFNSQLGQLKNRNSIEYGDKLFENRDGRFVEISREAGINTNVLGFGLGISIADFNDDLWPDIYVSNDFNEEDYLYINNQDGTFSESLRAYFNHVSLFSMGSDVGDLNNDGYMDLYTLDMLPDDNYRIKSTSGADNYDKYQLLLQQGFHKQSMRNMLQSGGGLGLYREVGQLAGISNSDWSWSALIADYDLDGWQDIFVTNGYLRDYTNMDFLAYAVDMKVEGVEIQSEEQIEEVLTQMPRIEVPNKMYHNTGHLSFGDSTDRWGFDQPSLSNGAAYGDLDNDGDLDLVVNNVNEEASVYRNHAIEAKRGNYLKVKPDRDNGKTNVIGLQVKLFGSKWQMQRELFPSRGYQSSVEPSLFFGLGKLNKIDSLVAIWPDGLVEKFDYIPINSLLILKKGTGAVKEIKPKNEKVRFTAIHSGSPFIHKENAFNDFHTQSLLPTLYSRGGPPLLAVDINLDGQQELICGGASGQATQILSFKNQIFSSIVNALPAGDGKYEDTDIAAIHADDDHYPDLLISSGGNAFSQNDERYLSRLYINKGNGTFYRANDFVEVLSNANSVVSEDFDGDGLEDLFIGSAYQAHQYPLPGQNHLLLQSETGEFSSAADLPFADYHTSDAIAVDLENDGKPELILAGEWEFVEVWSYASGQWTLRQRSPKRGWYSALGAWNLDEDPELEIIVGNHGLNSQLQASESHPMVLYFGDFDLNQTLDPILAVPFDGVLYPFVARDDLLGQLPQLKKRFTSYKTYAETTMTDLLTDLPNYQTDTIRQLATIILDIQDEKILKEAVLPRIAQVAPVYAIEHLDVDSDGDEDLILAGNNSHNRVKIGEIDANHGIVLENKGNLNFVEYPPARSGLNIKGDVRSVQKLTTTNGDLLIFGVNNQPLKMYHINTESIPLAQ